MEGWTPLAEMGEKDEEEKNEAGTEEFPIKSSYLKMMEAPDPATERHIAYFLESKRGTAGSGEWKEEGHHPAHKIELKKRMCVVAVPRVLGSETCGCGRLLRDDCHRKNAHEGEEGTWNVERHTEATTTDAMGRICFTMRFKKYAKYLRVASDTEPSVIADYIRNVWNLPKPGVILTINGSLLGFTISTKMEKIIQRGIIKAAITTNGWIATNGFRSGYVTKVGEALEKHNNSVPCIGFASWGCLPDPVMEALKHGGRNINYPFKEIGEYQGRQNIEENHSHFILTDNGGVTEAKRNGVSQWGSESHLWTGVESYLRDEIGIPLVQIMLQGGEGAARHLVKVLERRTPTVLVYGSGGICDLIVNLIRHDEELNEAGSATAAGGRAAFVRQKTSTKSLPVTNRTCTCKGAEEKPKHDLTGIDFWCPIVEKFFIDANLSLDLRITKFYHRIATIIGRYRDLLILFDMDDQHYDGLDTALLEGLIRAQELANRSQEMTPVLGRPVNSTKQLSGVRLALGWRRVDFAEKILRSEDSSLDAQALGCLSIKALAQNNHEFVELFDSHGASIEMVAANVTYLYTQGSNLQHLVRCIRRIVNKKYRLDSDRPSAVAAKTINRMINNLLGLECGFESNVGQESDPYFEVMIWAALCLHAEIAEYMWSNTQEPIRAALFVVMLMRKLGKLNKVLVTTTERIAVERIQTRFEELAINILRGLHNSYGRDVIEKALRSQWTRMSDMTYIDMAFASISKEFVAEAPCQELLSRRWKDGLAEEPGIWKVILIMVCPFLLLTDLVMFNNKLDSPNIIRRLAKRFQTFHISPSVKFIVEIASYCFYIGYQTYTVINHVGITESDGHNCSCSAFKAVWFLWFAGYLIEEIAQMYFDGWRWLNNVWNKLDLMMYGLNVLGIILTNIPDSDDSNPHCYVEEYYNWGRVVLACSSILFFLRILHLFIAHKYLGPTVLMVRKMARDFQVFLLMFSMVAIAFGIGYTVVLTDPADFTPENRNTMVAGVFFYTFFQMYGELFVDDLNSASGALYFPNAAGAADRAPVRRVTVTIMVGVYMAIVVLMLVNILIAMFSDTYSKVKKVETVVFKFQRLELLMEMEKSYLPPPLSIFHRIAFWCIERKKRARHNQEESEKQAEKSKWNDTIVQTAVIDSLEDYLKTQRSEKGSAIEAQLAASTLLLKRRMDKFNQDIDTKLKEIDRRMQGLGV